MVSCQPTTHLRQSPLALSNDIRNLAAGQARRITVDFRSLGLTGKYRLRDIWTHKQIASKATKWTGTVAAHETKVWVLE